MMIPEHVRAYYNLMMENIPHGITRADWEKEIIEDINLPEEVLKSDFSYAKFETLLKEYEQKS